MPTDLLQILGLEEHHAPVGTNQGKGSCTGAKVGTVAKQGELDYWPRDAVLDPPKHEEDGHSAETEQKGGLTTPNPSLDEGKDYRGETGTERRQSRGLNPPSRIGIGGLGRRQGQ